VLLKDARLLISNCTGVAHLAAAVKTPGLIISMDGEPERWGHPIHTVIDWTKKQSLKTVLESTDEMIAAY
jgi:ADP-heptose:LPS heptosyltransferase